MSQNVLKRLTEEQMRFFHEEGYLMVPDVFDPADLEPVRNEVEQQLDRFVRELHQHGELDETFPEADFNTRLARITEYNEQAGQTLIRLLQGRAGGGYSGSAIFDIIKHPKLLAVVEDIVGPEIVGSSVFRIRPKVPKLNKGVVPWHQDSGYLLKHCDQELILTCWLPLVEATVDNGCLSVLPRAHNGGVVRHYTGGNAGFLVIKDEDLPAVDASPIPVPVPLGGAVFFTNRTPHCSTPNSTDHVRWSFDLRYQSAEVPNNVDEDPDLFTFDRPEVEIACYPPEADFVIQSVKHPERMIRSAAQFQMLRDRYEQISDVSKFRVNRWTPL